MADPVHIKKFHPGTLPDEQLTYVIIGALEPGGWIYVRHRERTTWEFPAGHIEKDEPALDAARRELYEETGARASSLIPVADYSVTLPESTRFGRIFIARIETREPLPDFEIAENRTSNVTPGPATYPVAHRAFQAMLDDARENGIAG